jgi:1,4-dihydroxy-2-naphthoate octaprenyltransferase
MELRNIKDGSVMNVSMWGKALQVIPRITKQEWDGLDVISKWLISTRAAVLIMTFLSAAIAGMFALRDGQFNFGLWLLLVVGLVFAHATNNLVNDLTDYRRGVDKDNYFRTQYGPQPVQQGLMTSRQVWTYAAVTGLIALAAGLALVFLSGPLALLLLGLGAFFVLFYTWPLKYIGLGEIAVIVVWGPLMVGGGYFVITGHWDWTVALASLPYALGTTMVIFGKHIDKIESDTAKRIHTLPVIIGEKAARITTLVMMALQYVLVVYLVITRFFSPVMLVVFFGLTAAPAVWAVYKNPRPKERPADYGEEIWPLWFVALAFFHNKRFGMLFVLGLILDVGLKALHIL